MRIQELGLLKLYKNLPNGSVFLHQRSSLNQIMMKAFAKSEQGEFGWTTTLWSSEKDDEGLYAIYEADDLRNKSVLDLTHVYELAISPLAENLYTSSAAPSFRESVGLCISCTKGLLLGVRYFDNRPAWRTAFVNVASGELVWSLKDLDFFSYRKWELVLKKQNTP